jgi:hypothetical protein
MWRQTIAKLWQVECVFLTREDAKTLVQLRKYKEQPIQEAEARKLAQSLGRYRFKYQTLRRSRVIFFRLRVNSLKLHKILKQTAKVLKRVEIFFRCFVVPVTEHKIVWTMLKTALFELL